MEEKKLKMDEAITNNKVINDDSFYQILCLEYDYNSESWTLKRLGQFRFE